MSLQYIVLLSIALALDAFAVALVIGINPTVKCKNKVAFIISFGLFQFSFAFIGGYFGFLFSTYIVAIPKILGGMVVCFVGLIMLVEEMKESKGDNLILNIKTNIILGASVSIDAMVLGFTALSKFSSIFVLLKNTFIMGIIALIMTAIAFFISKELKKIKIFRTYADYIGGIILIIFGIKMMFL